MSERQAIAPSPAVCPARRIGGYGEVVGAQPPVDSTVDITIIMGSGMDLGQQMEFLIPRDTLPWSCVVHMPGHELNTDS